MDNQRPISLLSSMGKTLEKIIASDISTHLEVAKLLPPTQFGFRGRLSATGQALQLDNFLTDFSNQKRRQVKLAAFLDLEKAFDRVWRDSIIHKGAKLGIQPGILRLLTSFLKDRFQVKIGETFSTWYPAIEGVPQGAPLSPLLFNIAVYDPRQNLARNTKLLHRHRRF